MSLGSTISQQSAVINVDAYIGPGAGDSQLSSGGAITVFNWQSGASLTAGVGTRIMQTVAAGATNISFNLSTLFGTPPASPIVVVIADSTIPGVGFSVSSVSGPTSPWVVAPNGFLMYTPNTSSTPPTVFISNGSATAALNVLFALMAS